MHGNALLPGSTYLVFWTYAFMAVAYAMTAVCLYRGFRNGYEDEKAFGVIRELSVFSILAVLMFGVESWAHLRAPYYAYSATFTDLLPRYDFPWLVRVLGIESSADDNACTVLVSNLPEMHRRIPLSVVLFEASLVYAGMWTARRITRSLALQPLIAGLALLLIDLLLDPVVATAHNCAGEPKAAGAGVGLWRWYLPVESELCNGKADCAEKLVASIFDVPAFNYAAWLGAPIIAIAVVNIFPFLREGARLLGVKYRERETGFAATRPVKACLKMLAKGRPENVKVETKRGSLISIALILVAAAVVLHSAPSVSKNDPTMQYAALFGGLIAVVLLVFGHLPTFERHRYTIDGVLIVPCAFALVTGVVAGVFEDRFVVRPWLMPVSIVAVIVGLWLHFLPYRAPLLEFCKKLGLVDRFLRLHYFGFTSMLVLLGAALCCAGPTTFQIAGLLFIAFCFHAYSYVLNDAIDLKFDKLQPQRQSDPQVLGLVPSHKAIAFALACVPAAFLVLLVLIDYSPSGAPFTLPVLGAAFVLMFAYNYWGKKTTVPLLTDWAQGLAWGCLAILGTSVAELRSTRPLETDPTGLLVNSALLGAWGMLYIVLVSGVHGGLRDLVTDVKGGAHTTMRLFGAKPGASGKEGDVISNGLIAVYAHVVHVLHFATLGAFIWLNHDAPVSTNATMFEGVWLPIVVGSLVALFLVASYMLQRVVQRQHAVPGESKAATRSDWVGYHALLLLLPPMLVFWMANGPSLAFKVTVGCTTFVPLLFAQWLLEPLLNWIYSEPVESSVRPPGGGASSDAPPPGLLEPAE
jgi:4-hydroxybenzoate polyprenyltransferase